MPFGLTNAPAIFMRTMNNLFCDLLDRGIVAFMDDVLIYSSTIKNHKLLLKVVFTRLKEKYFYCKLKKYWVFNRRTVCLGHDITSEGVQINPNKIEAV